MNSATLNKDFLKRAFVSNGLVRFYGFDESRFPTLMIENVAGDNAGHFGVVCALCVRPKSSNSDK